MSGWSAGVNARRSWQALILSAAAVVSTCLWAGIADAATPAGTVINNGASATYVDPATPATILTTTSNIVTIRVAEVAGITVVPLAVTTVGGGLVVGGSTVNFDFTVRNTGNSPNGFSIPNTATVGGTAGATMVGVPQISFDGGVTFVPLPSGAGTFTGSGATGRLQTGLIPVNGTVIVRVQALVSPSAVTPSATVTAQLGNTAPNDNSPATQNQPYNSATVGNIFTTNTAAEPAPGPPLNGQREAAAISATTLGVRPQTFAQVLKAGTLTSTNANPQLDTIAYALTLNVLAGYPSASIALQPASLAATTMQLNGAPAQRVLVSDVVPALTVFTSVGAPPAGWTVVYSTDATSVANAVAFTTTAPAPISSVKRIGWIHPGPIPIGSTTTGFTFNVLTSGASSSGPTTILNLAQLFGQSQGDTTNAVVYDQSGDPYPSNFTAGNGTPGSSIPGTAAPGNGVAPVVGPNDPGGNTGQAGGANNVIPLNPQALLLNGPANASPATGPDGTTTTDLTVQSVSIPSGLAPGSGLPAPLQSTFTNTVGNPGTVALTNVTLVPQTPTIPNALPDGTTVAFSYPGQPTPVVYTYALATGWTLTSGTPISIPTLAPAAQQNYTVVVTLPIGTLQSTNGGAAANGFPVPILASSLTAAGTVSNLTTDIVFTGILKLTKTAQVFNADGTPCDAAPTPTPTPACVIPGNIVQYAITYTNIVPAASGGSIGASASKIVIVEDGAATPNTFAVLVGGVLVTSHIQGSASDTNPANVLTYFNSAGANVGDIVGTGTSTGDVSKYVDTFAAPLGPGQSGTILFRRKIN